MIAEFEAQLLAHIDARVEDASDDELFAGGYLQGHITLAVAQVEAQGTATKEALKVQVQQSIMQAISAGELSPPDQQLVLGLWEQLYQRVSQTT